MSDSIRDQTFGPGVIPSPDAEQVDRHFGLATREEIGGTINTDSSEFTQLPLSADSVDGDLFAIYDASGGKDTGKVGGEDRGSDPSCAALDAALNAGVDASSDKQIPKLWSLLRVLRAADKGTGVRLDRREVQALLRDYRRRYRDGAIAAGSLGVVLGYMLGFIITKMLF